MASHTSSDDGEDFALTLRLSQLSSDVFGERVARLHPKESAPADLPRPTPRSDEEDNVASASNVPQQSTDFDPAEEEESNGFASAGDETRQTTPGNEYREDDPLSLPQAPADDEPVGEFSSSKRSRATAEGSSTSLLIANPLLKVQMAPSLWPSLSLKIALG